jgi:hypothetical protein
LACALFSPKSSLVLVKLAIKQAAAKPKVQSFGNTKNISVHSRGAVMVGCGFFSFEEGGGGLGF